MDPFPYSSSPTQNRRRETIRHGLKSLGMTPRTGMVFGAAVAAVTLAISMHRFDRKETAAEDEPGEETD